LKFPVFQISLGVQNEIFMILHVSTLSAFAKIFKSQENSTKINETAEPENGRPQECCVFVTVSVFSSNFGPVFCSCFWCLVLLALTPFSFSCFCVRVGVLALSLSFVSLLLCVNLCCLLAAAAGSGWGASTSCKRESRRPLAPLALNKENFAVVASRSMTHHS